MQRGPLDAQIVDESAVQAVEIFDDQARAFVVDTGVVVGDSKIVHRNVVIRRPADRDWAAADGHFRDGFTFEHEAEFGHFSVLSPSRLSSRVCAPRGAARKAIHWIRFPGE